MTALGYLLVATGLFLMRETYRGRAMQSPQDARDLLLAVLHGDSSAMSEVLSRSPETVSPVADTVSGSPDLSNHSVEGHPGWHLDRVKPWVKTAGIDLGTKFNITTIGGYRSTNNTDKVNGHGNGLALDFMCGMDVGNQLAAYAKDNAAAYSILYIIHAQHIWSTNHPSDGWKKMEDRGSPTANHMDHVHISFKSTGPS